jgi:hypothetical protein
MFGFSPQANYTDWATAACGRSYCQCLRIEGVAWLAQRIPTALFSVCFICGQHSDSEAEDPTGKDGKATETRLSQGERTLARSKNQFHTHIKEEAKL